MTVQNKTTMRDRAAGYAAAFPQFPDSHFMVSDRWISATWILGNNYKSISKRGPDDKPFYGAYPPSYMRRIWSLFPDARRVIHLFSGSLTAEAAASPYPDTVVARIDSRADRNPDLVRDAELFTDIGERSEAFPVVRGDWDLILADPPYSICDAERYGVPLCNKKKVLEQCHLALRPGGILCWMDQSLPMYAKRFWKMVGVITMIRSTNHRVRAVFLFEKQ
jgi:hypothetical protein